MAIIRCLLLFVLVLCGLLSGCATSSRSYSGKTYVITGASSGFGRGVALKLGTQRANVVLAARRTDELEEVARQIEASGGKALVATTDVAQPADIRRLAAAAVSRFGRVDVWINNAGVGVIGPFWNAPVEDYSRLIDINLKGVVYGSHAALRQFLRQGYGTLVNIGSIDTEVPLACQAAYSATKAGVLGLGRALNEELRLAGYRHIKVATVMPWAADTPWWPHAANYSGHAPRMAGMDNAQKVVDGIVWVSAHPREELAVGWKARAAEFSHHVLPDLTERFSADVAHCQMEKGAPAPATSGTLFTPMKKGAGVEGGVRHRMTAEDSR